MSAEADGKKPKVSVIIATYNYSSVLRYAIATVLWQTFRDFELIVVGDCCTDDSQAVVESFGDPRIRWINLSENSGSKYIPQNAGIKIARGDLIAYLAHDDLWHPVHLETLVAAVEKNDADFAYTVAVYVPPPGDDRRLISGIYPEPFRVGYSLVHSSVMHSRSVLARIGEWPDHRKTAMSADHVFWNRVAAAGLRIIEVPKVTVWKFEASSRPGCYRDLACEEQARYFALIREDPELVERELLDVARSAMIHGLVPRETYRVGRDASPGGHIHRLRQIRGLEPAEPMELLPPEVNASQFQIHFADELPSVIAAGMKLDLEVRIENRSAFTLLSNMPYPVHLSYHWLRPDGTLAVYGGERSLLIPPSPAGSDRHYFMRIQAPQEPGSYRLQPSLVQELARWFDGKEGTTRYPVEVTPARSRFE